MKKHAGQREETTVKILPWHRAVARQQKREFDRGKATVCESAENIAILDMLVKQRRHSIARAVDKIEGLRRPEGKMRSKPTKVQALARELRRIKARRAKAKKLLAAADLSFIQDHRHGQLVALVEELRRLLDVEAG